MSDSYPRPGKNIASVEEHMRMFRGTGAGAEGVYDSTFSLSAGTSLKVTANGTSNVTVTLGGGNVPGIHLNQTANKTLAVPTNVGGATARKDLVVMRLTFDGDNTKMDLHYVTGGTTEPTVVRNFTTAWEVPLAGVTVPAGSAIVPSGNISNRRVLISRPSIIGDGLYRPPVTAGQTLVEPGRVLIGQTDNTWQQVWPADDMTFMPIKPYPTAGDGAYKVGWRNWNEAAGVSGYADGRYAVRDNVLYLKGAIQATRDHDAHAVMFRLPAGFRPVSIRVPCVWTTSGANRIDMLPNGDVQCTAGIDNTRIMYLDGVSIPLT